MTPLPVRGVRCRYPLLPDGTHSEQLEIAPAKLVGAKVDIFDGAHIGLADESQLIYFELGMFPQVVRLGDTNRHARIVTIDRDLAVLTLSEPLPGLVEGDELATYVQDGPWQPAVIVDGVAQMPEDWR